MLRLTLVLIILYSSTLKSQNQPKIDLSNLVQSIDEIITLLDECELDEKTDNK